MSNATINLTQIVAGAAPDESIRHALLLTFTFDGAYLEQAESSLLQHLWERDCTNIIVIRDGKQVLTEKKALRYTVLNAGFTQNAFHPKLLFIISASQITAILGSANLTRAGMENNLELATAYHLTRNSGPFRFFESLYAYLNEHLRQEVERNGSSPEGYDRLITDFRRFLEDAKRTKQSTIQEPIFFHNYAQSLLPQILSQLPSQNLDALWVLSPFFEPDTQEDRDPKDELDATLLHQLLQNVTLKEIGEPPLRIYFQSMPGNRTVLPLHLLNAYQSSIALYAKNSSGVDEKKLDPVLFQKKDANLHAKLMVFAGKKRGGKRFFSVVQGSANFTRGALLSQPSKGNSEIVVMTKFDSEDLTTAQLESYWGFDQLFARIGDWTSLNPISIKPNFQSVPLKIREALVSIRNKAVTVWIHSDLHIATVVRVSLVGDQVLYLGSTCMTPGEHCFEFALFQEAIELETGGLVRFPYYAVRAEAVDDEGRLVGQADGPLNVDSPEAFIDDRMLQTEESNLVDQIYAAGAGLAGSISYAALRKQIERIRFGKAQVHPTALSYQADLDLFFRHVQIGFTGIHSRVKLSGGSMYVFGDTLRQLARWITQAVTTQELEIEQRIYLCGRVVRAVREAFDSMKEQGADVSRLKYLTGEEFVKRAQPLTFFVTALESDPSLGPAVAQISQEWQALLEKATDRKVS